MPDAPRTIRRIFPLLISDMERTVLDALAQSSGRDRGAVLRLLLLREFSQLQLVNQSPRRSTLEKEKAR